MTKRSVLVAHDYGQGGVWAFLTVESDEQIRDRFPELQVFRERPSWMTVEDEEQLRQRMTVDIDDTDHPFLAAVLKSRD